MSTKEIYLDMCGVVMVFTGMRVSLICLLLVVETWNLLHHGVLASPYNHKYTNYQNGSTVFSGGSELHTPADALTSQHPSRNPKTPQIASVATMKVNIPQDSSRGMKSAYTPEHIEYGLLRSEAGGFTQNAPGSLYPGHPLKNEETITTVYTVPYFSINGERPGRFASNLVAQQPVQHTDVYVSPYGVTEMIPHTGYYKHGSSKTVQEPDARIGGKWAPQKLVFSNSVPVQSASSWSSGGQRPNRKSGLNHMAPNQHGGGKYERSYLPPFLREQVTNKQTFSQPPNIRPTPHINAPRLFSGEDGATTGKGLDNVPLQTSQTLQSVAARPPLAKNRGASRENGRGGNGIHQSPGRRFDATADGKQSKRFRVKTRYLVRAFNQYQQGRLYQSHGSNDLKETDFPSAGETLNIRIQSTDNPGSNGHKS